MVSDGMMGRKAFRVFGIVRGEGIQGIAVA
jgi:hypothetical protein